MQNNATDLALHAVTGDMQIKSFLIFEHSNGTKTRAKITGYATPDDDTQVDYGETTFTVNINPSTTTNPPTGYYEIETEVYKNKVELGWFNCYAFGNGVESDRIRDDFNAPQIDNGVKVSATFLNYGEEDKGSTLIYSGIYNSISSVNNLNEFNMSELITKDLNPSYGSVQALKTRDTDIIALAEDKVLRISTQKDALFNADGNAQLLASNRVLGTAIPYVGDYGISKNPESLAVDEYRMYFTDKQRGAVMRLSQNGLTPISSVGMKTYFRDTLLDSNEMLGTYDKVNSEYNLTLKTKESVSVESTTVSFNEGSKGWTSFKSFIPDDGNSVAGKYLTSNTGSIWLHNDDSTDRNTFYGTYYESSLSVVFNDAPGAVTRLVDMGLEPFLISASLEAILAQRLVRRICPDCRSAYEPSQELIDMMEVDPLEITDKDFYYGEGCSKCNNTGYRGRVGLFEMIVVSDAIRELINQRAPTLAIRQKALEQGMRSLRNDGLRAIFDGNSTIEEVLKYT